MRRFLRAAVLTSAVAGVAGVAREAAAAPAPANPPAAAQPQVPVRQVVLFSSGVGYFEHFGTVTGNGSTELRFKTAQINDILKSLILQDLDQGRILTITYPSQDPVARTLRSFQIDITANPALHDLLNQLRGAKVKVSAGGQDVAGTVLGVEKKQRPLGKAEDGKVVDVWYLNLVTGVSIRQVPLEDVRDLVLEDPQLREELNRALAALAQARDQDKKPVTINFQGRGERRVRIGYVVETPVWKTSYRLMLDEAANPAGPGGPATRPATWPAQGGAAAGGKLQGWAIVENQTDNDWADVQLSLVSGRPISFIQDLYQPLYVPRPVVQPELYASLRPQTYDAGLELGRQVGRFGDRQELNAPMGVPGGARSGAAPAQPPPSARPAADEATPMAETLSALDPAASVSSIASAAKVGELFQYTVGSVSLPRQKSAMIPIITDAVEVEKLSIYNQGVLARNPLLGARLKNTTDKHLLQGPITVLDGGAYAGDAKVEDLPPGQERLISYGVDQQVSVLGQNHKADSSLMTGKIVKGVLHLTFKEQYGQEYVASNKGEKNKTLVIEHPRRGPEWKLVEPARADETTDALYRFKGALEAGKARSLSVREERVRGEAFAILPMELAQLRAYALNSPLPQDVKEALGQAAALRWAVAETERLVKERQQRVNEVVQEQARIRENLKTVPQESDYYKRLLGKLNEQETQIEALQKEVDEFQKTHEQQRKELEDYISKLDVG